MNPEKKQYRISLVVYGTDLDPDALRYFIPLTIPVESLSVEGDISHASVSCVTAEPWHVMEYCSTVGDMDEIAISRES